MTNISNACPCGTTKTYDECCGVFHKGGKPKTAEQLMRSRYSAYVVGNVEYIGKTNDPETGSDFDPVAAENWSKKSKWIGLEIVAASENEVEFKARFIANGTEYTHHEVSLFRFDATNAQWVYRDGKTIQEPERRAEAKLGRNDPCKCGSGKKSKKCCAA